MIASSDLCCLGLNVPVKPPCELYTVNITENLSMGRDEVTVSTDIPIKRMRLVDSTYAWPRDGYTTAQAFLIVSSD